MLVMMSAVQDWHTSPTTLRYELGQSCWPDLFLWSLTRWPDPAWWSVLWPKTTQQLVALLNVKTKPNDPLYLINCKKISVCSYYPHHTGGWWRWVGLVD